MKTIRVGLKWRQIIKKTYNSIVSIWNLVNKNQKILNKNNWKCNGHSSWKTKQSEQTQIKKGVRQNNDKANIKTVGAFLRIWGFFWDLKKGGFLKKNFYGYSSYFPVISWSNFPDTLLSCIVARCNFCTPESSCWLVFLNNLDLQWFF